MKIFARPKSKSGIDSTTSSEASAEIKNALENKKRFEIAQRRVQLKEELEVALERKQTQLNFTFRKLSDDDVHLLSEKILNTPECNITFLDLANNEIGAIGAGHVSLLLQQHNSTLADLVLRQNSIGDVGVEYIVKALLDAENNTLTSLNLSNNGISDDSAIYLGRLLKHNSSLIDLELHDNNIGEQGANFLAGALADNTALLHLDLSNNNLGTDGIGYFAYVLSMTENIDKKFNSSLQTLNIAENNFDGMGACHLAYALQCNYTLKTLNVSGNNIDDYGMKFLAQSLSLNRTLTSLVIEHVHLDTMKCTEPLAAALMDNSTLRRLDLSRSSFGEHGLCILPILASLLLNTGLTHLDLQQCKLEDHVVSSIEKVLKQNETLIELSLNSNLFSQNNKAVMIGLAGLHDFSTDYMNFSRNSDHPAHRKADTEMACALDELPPPISLLQWQSSLEEEFAQLPITDRLDVDRVEEECESPAYAEPRQFFRRASSEYDFDVFNAARKLKEAEEAKRELLQADSKVVDEEHE